MKPEHLKISIVTVSFNAVDTIEQTILSVLTQNYDNVEYIIIDGGSVDGTVDIIKKYSDKLAYWVSEPDNGMYDALVKGFSRVTGDICAYINADDFYQQGAFRTVNELFQNSSIKWLTGIVANYNIRGQIIEAFIPYRYRSNFLQKGLYNGIWLPLIQQESTFWSVELLKYVDKEKLRACKLAGDFFLWRSFSQYAELQIVSCILSGFRLRSGQLSGNIDAYRQEMVQMCDEQPNFMDKVQAVIDKILWRFAYKLNKRIIVYDVVNDLWKPSSEFSN